MAQAEPLSLAETLFERLNGHIIRCGHLNGFSRFELAGIERDIASLEKSDAASAHLYRGLLAVATGDLDKALYHYANARRLGALLADCAEVNTLSNLGYATRTLNHARACMRPGAPDISAMFPGALAAGAAFTVQNVILESLASGQLLSESANPYIPLARDISAALNASGHTEDQLAEVLDVAGEVLRENRLLWLDSVPIIHANTADTEESSPGVHYFYRVDVTGAEGAALTGEIGWRLVERELVFPALTVALMGVRRESRSAA